MSELTLLTSVPIYKRKFFSVDKNHYETSWCQLFLALGFNRKCHAQHQC